MMDRKRRAARRTRPLAPAAEVLELRQLLAATPYMGTLTASPPDIYAPSAVGAGDYTIGSFKCNMSPYVNTKMYSIAIVQMSGASGDFKIYGGSISTNNYIPLTSIGSATTIPFTSSDYKYYIVPQRPLTNDVVVKATLATIKFSDPDHLYDVQLAQPEPYSVYITIHPKAADPNPKPEPPSPDEPDPSPEAGGPLVPPGPCPTSDEPQILSGDSNPGGNPAASMSTSGGVDGFNGAVASDPVAFVSAGFGKEWGQVTGWTSVAAYSAGGVNGRGFVGNFQPTVQQTGAGYRVVNSATDVDWFVSNGPGVYAPQFSGQKTFVVTGSGAASEFVVTDELGSVLRFYGPGASASLVGKFKSFTDPYYSSADPNTHKVTANYNGSGQLTSEVRSGGGVTETYDYTYVAAGANAGLMETATLSRSNLSQPVRRVRYSYYAAGSTDGNAGDLQLEEVQQLQGATWVVLDTSYFRYYTANTAPGYADGLKYVFHQEAYARLAAAGAAQGFNPLTALDSTIAPYADNYYEYDAHHRVTKSVVQGAGCSCSGSGAGEFTYVYSTSPFAGMFVGDFNVWTSKTVETLPDGNRNVYYYNFAGEPILKAFSDVADAGDSQLTGKVWATYYRYDAAGRLIMSAQPSAVTITTPALLASAEANFDLIGADAANTTYQYLAASTGVLNLYEYAATTTAGDVAGYLKADWIKNGYSGTPIQLDSFQYFTRTDANGAAIHPLASSTVYRDAGGAGARTTTYAYTWYGTTNGVNSVTVTLPKVDTPQNGPNVADVETTVYDAYGRPVWFKDADGFIHYTAYDMGSGAVVKTIVDVDAARFAPADVPSGFATPSGGGLHLITTYEVDGLGRTTRMVDPDGRVTYWVYNDLRHEVRTYRGWNATTGTTTGPIEVTRYDYGNNFDETFTMATAAAKSGGAGTYVPTGAETVANLRSLSRILYDKGGRVVEVDDYFDFTGAPYSATSQKLGAAGTNYYATTYGYDHRGRTSRIVDALGTITFYVYDSLGRVATTSVGTSDIYSLPPATSDMKIVARYEYDGRGVGDGNLTKATTYPNGDGDSGTPVNPRVTQYAYDWRNRLAAVKGGVQTSETDTTINRPIVFYDRDNLGEVTGVSLYDGDGVAVTASRSSIASLLRAYTEYAYDDQGRLYGQKTYSVNQIDGSYFPSVYLSTSIYYDRRGHAIANRQPGGLVSKARYDGAGRLVSAAQTDGSGGATWAAAGSLKNDRVLSETRIRYNGAGVAILVASLDRNHDAGAATGPLFSPGSPGLADDGFEDGTIAGTGLGAYVYGAGGVIAGSAWSYSSAGISANGTDFTNWVPYSPQGNKVAFLQGGGSISQTSTDWQAGDYTITFKAAQRVNIPANQGIQVKVDGDVKGTFYPPAGGAWRTFSATFTLTAGGKHTIAFVGTSVGSDAAFIDGVSIAFGSSNPVAGDSGFEDGTIAGTGLGAYVYGGVSGVIAGSAWTFDSKSGISANGTNFTNGNPNAPQGGKVAFVQKTGSISQSIAGWQAGTYTIFFQAAQRGNIASNQGVQVKVDGVVVATFTLVGTAYQSFAATFTISTAASHTIAFVGTSAVDDAAFIDGVSIAATDARASYSAYYYDAADRLTQAVDVGANGGYAYSRPSAAPARSDAAHVVDYRYDDAGRVDQVTDPRGLYATTTYDALGRALEVVSTGPGVGAPSTTTRYTYDGLDHVRTVTAVGSTNQTTTYNYGITTATGSKINSNSMLRSVVQPDASASTYTYNALGQVLTATDAVGTVHTYGYDVVGRTTSDAVTTLGTLGTLVDGAVRRIETAYDTAGRAYLFTSYNAAAAGAVVNQVFDQFNGFGQLTAEYQDHAAAVNTSTSPKVQYAYSTPSSTQNYSRLTTTTYPNGRVVGYVYDAGIDATVSRLSSIADGGAAGTVLESYKYLGLGTIVERAQPGAKLKLTYVRQAGDAAANGDGGDQYTGVDRFGRVIDQNWLRTAAAADGSAAGTSTVRLQYGYDRDDNALFRRDLVNTALSELYQYDALNRLSSFKRGALSASTPGGPYDTVATPDKQQSWTLDAQGNWGGFTNVDGTTTTTTTKTFNAGNQTAAVTVNGSTAAAPTYDADGNTKTKDGKSYVYDAWNRLVAVKSGATTLASYAYDALRRRIKETPTTGSATDVYFTPGSQVIEERIDATIYQTVAGATGQTVFRDISVSGALHPEWRYYAQQNANGDVVALIGGSTTTGAVNAGNVLERYGYSPYGDLKLLNPDGTSRASSPYAWRFFFQGGRLDAATGLYVFQNRDYDPAAGVWMQRDPIGLAAGDPNLYRFVGNDPVNFIDPTGLAGDRQEGRKAVEVVQTMGQGSRSYDVTPQVAPPMLFGPNDIFWGVFGNWRKVPAGNNKWEWEQGPDNIRRWAKDQQAFQDRIPFAPGPLPPAKAIDDALHGQLDPLDLTPLACMGAGLPGRRNPQGKGGTPPSKPPAKEPQRPMVGAKGPTIPSLTIWKGKGRERIDIENPSPGKRPGQIHYQDNQNNKYIYDQTTDSFRDAPKPINDLLSDPLFRKAIEKGLTYLGEKN
ncbi:MAG: RHS repeat-associated core domain-containing protein [Paludisphaera borealis]|uniref:RHS repeat-associated core domain-containing protein n=1 Tax=Paludisphaera borealis TaxID=1387353 RepID=UPI0028479524|nr:RHS repeat-associated core domain-containing protein [Paludisphaera borealis]MDR3618225.1 RHS repeat-associated core domain-containing protein [Paludisphaera borealis]